MAGKITASELRDWVSYDPETGLFRYNNDIRSGAKRQVLVASAGDIAGSQSQRGYWRLAYKRREYLAHRLAYLWMMGKWPDAEIDHINGQLNDNRWCNLRPATRQQQAANRKCHGRSGFKGVSWQSHAGKWRSCIMVGGISKHLGYFETAELAHAAYMVAANSAFGEFAFDGKRRA